MMSKCSKLSLLGDVGNKSVHGVVWWWCVGWEHRGVIHGAWRRHLWGHGNVTHGGVDVFPIHTEVSPTGRGGFVCRGTQMMPLGAWRCHLWGTEVSPLETWRCHP